MQNKSQYTLFVQQALQEAAQIASHRFGTVSAISIKGGDNNQVLTETDLQVGNFLIHTITNAFPDHNIIDEEAGVIDKKSQYTWVIDPIDGTSNFAVGVPNYGIIIGLLFKNTPIVGGVSLPFYNEIIVAQNGSGAQCNGKRLRVTEEKNLLSALVAYAIDAHQEDSISTRNECKILADIVLGIRNLRSAGSVFDGIMVAKGKYGGYLNQTSRIWDNVGQQVIIEEAGGIYTDFLGHMMDYSNPLHKAKDNFTCCAGAPKLHRQLQKIIHNVV